MPSIDVIFHVYILQSQVNGIFYIDGTNNLEDRFHRHNKERNKFTKPYRPFALVYSKSFDTHSKAILFEKSLKAKKSREYIFRLIEGEV